MIDRTVAFELKNNFFIAIMFFIWLSYKDFNQGKNNLMVIYAYNSVKYSSFFEEIPIIALI